MNAAYLMKIPFINCAVCKSQKNAKDEDIVDEDDTGKNAPSLLSTDLFQNSTITIHMPKLCNKTVNSCLVHYAQFFSFILYPSVS